MKLTIILTFILLFSQVMAIEKTYEPTNHIKIALAQDIANDKKKLLNDIYTFSSNNSLWNNDNKKSLFLSLNNPLFNYKMKAFNSNSIKKLMNLIQSNKLDSETNKKINAMLDISLTYAYLSLLEFVVEGDIDWKLVQKKITNMKNKNDINAVWEMSSKSLPNETDIFKSIKNNDIEQFLTSLIPMEKRYKKLVKLLIDYNNMDKFPKINYKNNILKKGDYDDRIVLIKKRLQITGEYPRDLETDDFFDEALEAAMINFQKRHLVKATGRIGKTSTYHLNYPKRNKIQSIITNLDKTKLYPKSFEEEHVEVNIPEFKLRYNIKEKTILNKNVVVGRTDRPTPIFSDEIKYMVLNPTWTIPVNLVKRDLIPTLQNNPNYLKNKNIHTFQGKEEVEPNLDTLIEFVEGKKNLPYKFVQFAGDNNALGRVKFMFPNKHAVYLHDTNNKSLFSERYRIYSSGCMRIEKPFELVDNLLANTWKTYKKDEINDILKSMKPTNISFKKPIPVHILYFTTFEKNGKAHFINDIYLYDKIIEESSEAKKIAAFEMPSKRMVSVKNVH